MARRPWELKAGILLPIALVAPAIWFLTSCSFAKRASARDTSPAPIPVTGPDVVPLHTDAVTLLELPDGRQAAFSPGSAEAAVLSSETETTLPTTLPNGNIFVSGMTINAIASGAGLTTLPAGATLTVAFTIPPEYTGRTLGLLFWDSTLDENLGGWIDLRTTLPPGGQGAIAPTVTPDRRLTFSGNFPGTFVLVALRS